MSKKYEFTGITKNVVGRKLHQIRAIRDFGSVKAGDTGGWIASEKNLSHEGNCWVGGNGMVTDDAVVSENACVRYGGVIDGHSRVRGYAIITDYARILDDSEISGTTIIGGYVHVKGHSYISGESGFAGRYPIIDSRLKDVTFYYDIELYTKVDSIIANDMFIKTDLYSEHVKDFIVANIPNDDIDIRTIKRDSQNFTVISGICRDILL